MANSTVMGVFESPHAAEQAKEKLLAAGVGLHRIVVSRVIAGDGSLDPIVGKVPDPGVLVRSNACVVTVAARSPQDRKRIAELMQQNGARATQCA